MMKNCFKQISLIGTLATLPLGLLLLSLPQQSADARSNPSARNQFDACIGQMINSGVEAEDAGTACSDAYIPRELSSCVARIRGRTPIEAKDALDACYQVRRPIDLANCVVDIHRATPVATKASEATPATEETTDSTQASPSLIVLDSCRRSLLPGRYSECVIALSRNGETASPIAAMNTCLSAEDFPRDLFPAYSEN